MSPESNGPNDDDAPDDTAPSDNAPSDKGDNAESSDALAVAAIEPLRMPSRRHVTRVAVVQTLYQADMTGRPLLEAAKEMREHYLSRAMDGETPLASDPKFFNTVIAAVDKNGTMLVEMVQSALQNRPLERMEIVLQSILIAGAAELFGVPDAPPKVTISEYVEITDHFFGRSEAALVNATLDKIGHLVRPDEF